ncbi:MAG: hypothetical protein IJU75_02860 [Clostridia bacterium]|nr:hypothetical protein [Clostridia bacterium]
MKSVNYTARTSFLKKALIFLLVFSLAPQLLCTVLRYVGQYAGNDLIYEATDVVVSVVGTAAVFVGYGTVIYLVFLFGTGFDGLIVSAVSLTAYVLSFVLILITESYTVGLVCLSITAVFSGTVFVMLMKKALPHAILCVFFAVMPYAAAFATVALTVGADTGELLGSSVYGLMNLGLDLTMFVLATEIALIFASHAARTGKNIVVGGSVVAHGRPVLAAALVLTAVYAAAALAGYIPSTVSDVGEYGPPVTPAEIFETVFPYLRLAVACCVGYFSAAFAVNRLEDKWFECDDAARRVDRLKRGKNDLGRT